MIAIPDINPRGTIARTRERILVMKIIVRTIVRKYFVSREISVIFVDDTSFHIEHK